MLHVLTRTTVSPPPVDPSPELLLPLCDSDVLELRPIGTSRAADVVPMHRMQRAGPTGASVARPNRSLTRRDRRSRLPSRSGVGSSRSTLRPRAPSKATLVRHEALGGYPHGGRRPLAGRVANGRATRLKWRWARPTRIS